MRLLSTTFSKAQTGNTPIITPKNVAAIIFCIIGIFFDLPYQET
jgi:hypothetical protein